MPAVTPNASLLLCTAGLLLGYVECNRPGRVVPGALGLLLLLLGVHGLAAMPVHVGAVAALAAGTAVFVGRVYAPGWGLWHEIGGTVLLVAGLLLLPARPGLLDWRLSLVCGLLAGVVTAVLARWAAHARWSKRGHAGATAGARASGVREQWEPAGRVD